jgi:hypothetical protein
MKMDKIKGRSARVVMTLVGGLALVVAAPMAAFATPSDTATAVSGSFTSLLGDITGTYLPALLGLVAVGVGVRLGIKWLRRGASST